MANEALALHNLKSNKVFVKGINADGVGNFYTAGELISYELFKNGNPKSISLDVGVEIWTIPFNRITLIEEMAA